MDIIVHGTKGGYHIFSPSPFRCVFDARPDSGKSSAIGQEAYAIHFDQSHYVFSKYKIIRDVPGDKRTGNLAVSLALAYHEKMSGADVKMLLDNIFDAYCSRYLAGNNLDNVRENWSFIHPESDAFVREYKTRLRDNHEAPPFNNNPMDAAFIYYKDANELQRYFDAPFQIDEYSPYRQIFFVRDVLRGTPENPLNALRHSENDLTGWIDLDNRYYYLNNYTRNKGVAIIANGRPLSDAAGAKLIRAKWPIEIHYSKDERCYYPIKATGTIVNPQAEIRKYLDVRNNQIAIKYDAFHYPVPKTKSIAFDVKYRGSAVADAVIFYKNRHTGWQEALGHTIDFEGEDLKENWTFCARQGDGLLSEYGSITPADSIGNTFPLILKEYKKVEFYVVNPDGQPVYDFNIQLRDKTGKTIGNTNSYLEFFGDDIYRSWNIAVTCRNYENCHFGYCPNNDENPKFVQLKTKQFGGGNSNGNNHRTGFYQLKVNNKKGKRSCNKGRTPLPDYVKGKPNFKCDAKFGYAFTGWKPVEESDELYDGYYKAVFRKKWFRKIPKIVWLSGGFALVAIAVLVVYFSVFRKPDSITLQVDSVQIETYVEGDELFLDKLNEYKYHWDKQKPGELKKGINILDIFTFNNKKVNATKDTIENVKWDSVAQSIERAIRKREWLNSFNFAELRDQETRYSEKQQSFKNAINRIDTTQYTEIGEKLGNVHKLTLTEIADSILTILSQPTPNQKSVRNRGNSPSSQTGGTSSSSDATNNSTRSRSTGDKDIISNSDSTNKEAKNSVSSIIEYIRGDELKKEKLRKYLDENGIAEQLKNNIQLCLDFWELDGSKLKTYCLFREKVEKNNSLSDSKLLEFLKDACAKESDNPTYPKKIPGAGDTIPLSKLKINNDKK